MRTVQALLSFQHVTKRFDEKVAVDSVDLEVAPGRVLGIVGESGSGKTTCVRLALGLERPDRGIILYRGDRYPHGGKKLKRLRRRIGFVFQDPYDSLDERMKIGEIVAEPLRIHGTRRTKALARAAELLDAAGLPDADLDSYPSEFSGGGRQRIAIARSLAIDPEILICDEPTASLDVSVQAQIVNLLLELKESRELALIFVSHDLRLIGRIADNVVVMLDGRVVESGPAGAVLGSPSHEYTRQLMGAAPGSRDRRRAEPDQTEEKA